MTSLEKEENAVQSVDNLDESKDKKKKAFFQKKNTKDKPKKHIWGKKAFFYFVTGTLLLAGVSLYPFLKPGQKNVWIPHLKWFTIQNSPSIKFEPFIIPFRENGKFTYISLSISFELPNKELMDEMIEKNNWIRGVIYNILSENIYVLENVSSLMKLKKIIINNVNAVLTSGRVNNAIITDFSTV
jgi:flagellar basal body-associated protein FliL